MIAAIQAGGRSSRMGDDKSWLEINGRPMIEYSLSAAQPIADKLQIVIHSSNKNLARYENLAVKWKAELLFDLHDFRGPLGGIETVLRQCSSYENALILACDLPFITTEFLQFLAQLHTTQKSALTVPCDELNRPQMLAAIYSASCLQAVTALLTENELKARLLCAQVTTSFVDWAAYKNLPHAERLLINVNAPSDYEKMSGAQL